MSKVLLISGRGMISIENELKKIASTFVSSGCEVEFVQFDRPRISYRDFDLAIWFTPFLSMFAKHLYVWRNIVKLKKLVFYSVIEGVHDRIEVYRRYFDGLDLVTPSIFSARCMSDMGFEVSDVIPHEVPLSFDVDFDYARYWRSKFPSNKKVLLYNGSNIVRKGLSKLREAIDILSRKRNDFVMVLHTDDFRYAMHTPVSRLQGVNTVIELDFSRVPYSWVLGKLWACDVFVFPSVCEGFGLPVAEALALGKPLVCVDAPGVNEIASPGNSWMVTDVVPKDIVWSNWITYKAVDYSAKSLAEEIDLCLDACRKSKLDKVWRGKEDIKRFHGSYKRFLSFLSS